MTGQVRPTSEQFDAALTYAENHGIGLERALLMQQQGQIAAVQAQQSSDRFMTLLTAFSEQVTPVLRRFVDSMNDLARSPAWPLLLELAEAEVKAQRRAANRARWQARRRSR